MTRRMTRHRADEPPVGAPGPALPAWKAFVVQFSRDADAAGGGFCGRVEHLSSGRRSAFASRQELLAILEQLLGDLEDRS